MPLRIRELKPIKESPADYEEIEKRIRDLLRREIYLPAIKMLGEPAKALQNDRDALFRALRAGRVTFSRGLFSGRFNAEVSKELRRLGAQWDRKTGTFKILQSSLPREVREVIAASESRFSEKIAGIDKKLAQILPEEIAGRIRLSDAFDRTLWKTNREFEQSVKGVTVAPKLSDDERKKIADEWETNLKLHVKDFTNKEVLKLRGEIKKAVFSGDRYESAVKTIQASYGVAARKAKFLARQETSLLMAKFKEVRYTSAGIYEYTWHAVTGSPAHPVRPQHKKLAEASKKGKIFRWDDPPITTEPGEPARRNNPGQDYNCRCFARPVVRFAKA